MVITRTTLRANFFTDVYAIINSNITDPLSRGKQWVFSSTPDVLANNFVGYPFITINKAKINKEHELFDNSYSDVSTPLIITVYSTNNVLIDSISDQIDMVIVPSNFPQFKFINYDEQDGKTDFGAGNVLFRSMNYSVEIDKI